MKIKTGDTVRCINSFGGFERGEQYCVIDHYREDIAVEDEFGDKVWFRPTFLPFELI